MSNIMMLTDPHVGKYGEKGKNGPLETTLLANALFKNQLRFFQEIVIPAVDRHNIKHIIWLGDLWDNIEMLDSAIADEFYDKVIRPLLERGVEMHMIVGNHDCRYKHHNKNNVYFFLIRGTPIKSYYEPQEVVVAGMKFMFIPWISPKYFDSKLMAKYYDIIKASKARVACAHLGFNGGIKSTSDEEHPTSLVSHFDTVFSGHYHDRNTIQNIHYIGATQCLHFGENPEKGYTIFDTEKYQTIDPRYETATTFHRNPFQIFYDYTYNDTNKTFKQIIDDLDQMALFNSCLRLKIEAQTRPLDLDKVIEHIKERKPIKFQVNDVSLKPAFVEDVVLEDPQNIREFFHQLLDSSSEEVCPRDQVPAMKKLMTWGYNQSETAMTFGGEND